MRSHSRPDARLVPIVPDVEPSQAAAATQAAAGPVAPPTTSRASVSSSAVPGDDASQYETPRRWYRAEPWLAVELAAVLVMLTSSVFSPPFRIALVGLSALLTVAGAAMLVRQGPFRESPGPGNPSATRQARHSRR